VALAPLAAHGCREKEILHVKDDECRFTRGDGDRGVCKGLDLDTWVDGLAVRAQCVGEIEAFVGSKSQKFAGRPMTTAGVRLDMFDSRFGWSAGSNRGEKSDL
jgi:hypothetical protein